MTMWEKIKRWYRRLPDRKRYFEFLTAVLTIPVLLTVLISNVNSIKDKSKDDGKNTVTVIPIQVKETNTGQQNGGTIQKAVTPIACVKKVGPITIVSPKEGEEVSKDPVCINISYEEGDYCGVVWSYRINNSQWSDYSDKSICLYNLSGGDKDFELHVKSIASSDEKYLTRSFSVVSKITPTPTNLPAGGSSPTPSN